MGQSVADCFAHVMQVMRVLFLGRLFGAHMAHNALGVIDHRSKGIATVDRIDCCQFECVLAYDLGNLPQDARISPRSRSRRQGYCIQS